MAFEFRVDVGTMRPVRRQPDGRIIADVLITKPGIFEYADTAYPGGIRRELRPESEVFSRETMDSFKMMPATPVHPPKLLDSTTAKHWSVGATGSNVTRSRVDGDDDHVLTEVMVSDAKTVQKMDDGDTAVSVGYSCRTDMRAGVDPKYGRYDLIQRDIRGNHLAVGIGAGRAGRMARVRMDAEITPAERAAAARGDDVVIISDDDDDSVDLQPVMIAFTTIVEGHQHTLTTSLQSGCTSYANAEGTDLGHSHEWLRTADGKIQIAENAGHSHDVDPAMIGVRGDRAAGAGSNMNEVEKLQENLRALEQALKASEMLAAQEKTRADAAETARDSIQGRMDQVDKEIGELKVKLATGAQVLEVAEITKRDQRIDQLEQKVARFDETHDKAVKARTALMFKAGSVLGSDFRMDDLSERQIMCAVVKRLDATADVTDGVPDGNIAGQFDQLLKRRLSRARQEANVSEIIGTGGEQSRADSRSTRLEDYRSMGKRPLSEVLTPRNKTQKGA